MKTRKRIASHAVEGIIVMLVLFALWYIMLPAFNIHSMGMWMFIGAVAVIVAVVVLRNKGKLEDEIDFDWRRGTSEGLSEEEEKSIYKELRVLDKIIKVLCIIVVAIVILCFVGNVASCSVFHAQAYRNLANVKTGNFEEDFPEADPTGSNIPFVSMEIAQQLGDRTIANVPGAEFYEVDDEYNLIEYQGDYYRISSLSYGGIFKYFSANSNGIPGYVLVNVRTQKATFCYVDGGYYYSPSSLFFQNLRRHLRTQYPTAIFDEKSYFEIDEDGHPYWITPVISKTIMLFGGDKVENIIITDAVSGESMMYGVDNLPEWVDHAMLLRYLKEKATDYYELVHGAFNFSDKDVKKISVGYTSFVNENGEVCFTMGLTPANEAKSNIGFILINSRTGEIKEYIADGIQEETAQSRVETLVQNYGYRATFPQVINVDGIPTYLMCLTGEDGLIQDVALACISTTSNATAYAPTLEEAMSKYRVALGNGSEVKTEEPAEIQTVEGTIQNIYSADIEGTTYFFYVLEDNDVLFKASVSINERQVLATPGMQVKLTYNTDSDVINVTSIEIK